MNASLLPLLLSATLLLIYCNFLLVSTHGGRGGAGGLEAAIEKGEKGL